MPTVRRPTRKQQAFKMTTRELPAKSPAAKSPAAKSPAPSRAPSPAPPSTPPAPASTPSVFDEEPPARVSAFETVIGPSDDASADSDDDGMSIDERLWAAMEMRRRLLRREVDLDEAQEFFKRMEQDRLRREAKNFFSQAN
jgi:3-oxoacyl-ACP reductase-like protein